MVRGLVFCTSLALMALGVFGLDRMVGRRQRRQTPQRQFAQDWVSRPANPSGKAGRRAVTLTDERTGAAIYDVVYTLDALGYRMTAVDSTRGRNRFIGFVGCSVTFGEGVQDDETLPYHVGQLTTRSQPYNYGRRGGGPAETLRMFEERDVTADIRQADGVWVYTFIDDHIERTVGASKVIAWGPWKPYYEITPDGEAVYLGTFEEVWPWRTKAYRLLHRSHIVQALHVSLPRITDRHLERTAQLITALAASVRRQFPASAFTVVLYPGARRAKAMAQLLKAGGVDVLDYSALFRDARRESPDAPLKIPDDGHPTSFAYQLLARALVRDLHLE